MRRKIMHSCLYLSEGNCKEQLPQSVLKHRFYYYSVYGTKLTEHCKPTMMEKIKIIKIKKKRMVRPPDWETTATEKRVYYLQLQRGGGPHHTHHTGPQEAAPGWIKRPKLPSKSMGQSLP